MSEQAVAGTRVDAQRLALVARHTGQGIVIYGPGGRIDWVNDAFAAMSGFGAGEAVGARRLDLVRGPFTRSPEFARLAEDFEAMRATSVEFVTQTLSGTPYWVEMTVVPVVEDGLVTGLIGVEQDVTARRQAQERARQTLRRAESLGVALRHEKHLLSVVLGTIPHVVWWKDTDLRYVGCNPAFLAWRGLATQAEMVGRTEAELETGDDIAAQIGPTELAVLDAAIPAPDFKVVVPAARDVPGARPRTYLVSVLPHLEHGVLAGVIGIGADVSQVTDLERQLAQAGRLESIGQLAAGIAHEINTPVQYICDNTRFVTDSFTGLLDGLRELAELTDPAAADGSAALLRERLRSLVGRLDLPYLCDEVPSALSQSMEGLDRVAQIVKAMKDFSNPGQGRAPTDLNRAVETTVQVSRSEWTYVAELELDLDPLVGQVACHEGEVKQALLNVVVNAAQAVQERLRDGTGGVPGRIRVSTAARPGEVLISVQDNGIGMDGATQERIFDPFFTTKDVGQGTGQGLSLAHATIVTKHGGRISVTSAPGEGTTVTFALPRATTEPGPQ